MTDDDRGVLGNLPRSRPGQRSEKREGRTAAEPAAPAKAAGPGKEAGSGAASAKAAGPSPASAKKAAGPRRTAPPPREPARQPGDPVGDAIRTVTGVAATGARAAGGVAREVLRRLPRP